MDVDWYAGSMYHCRCKRPARATSKRSQRTLSKQDLDSSRQSFLIYNQSATRRGVSKLNSSHRGKSRPICPALTEGIGGMQLVPSMELELCVAPVMCVLLSCKLPCSG